MPMPDNHLQKQVEQDPPFSRKDGYALPPEGRPVRKVEMTQIVARSR